MTDPPPHTHSKELSTSWATHLQCSETGVTQALDKAAFLSPAGKPWLVQYDLSEDSGALLQSALSCSDSPRPWSLWRYQELLPLQAKDLRSRVDLGEGGTPLLPLKRTHTWLPQAQEVDLLLKQEALNPTGSFKDRGLSLAVNRARELGAQGVQLPSAGNAAIALSAYAAAAGLPARVAMPSDTPKVVIERCLEVGADVHTVGSDLLESARFLGQQDDTEAFWNLATLKEPYRAEGKKTMGLELAEQLQWEVPDWILYPTGGGTGIVGMAKAFAELEALGMIGSKRPKFAVVQMNGCAPIVRAFELGQRNAEPWQNPNTKVWGLRVPMAIGDFLILDAVRSTGGTAISVDESKIPEITRQFREQEGHLLGPEGAAVLLGLQQLLAKGLVLDGDRVALFQTGHPANY